MKPKTQSFNDMVWYVSPDTEAVETQSSIKTAQDVIHYFAWKRVTVFQIEGHGTLEAPLQRNGWNYIPLELDHLILYKEAQKRLAEAEGNFKIQQWIIGHEEKSQFPVHLEKQTIAAIKKTALAGITAIALVAVVIFAVAALVALVYALGTILLVLLGLTAVGIADPRLILVTQAGDWVVISSDFS